LSSAAASGFAPASSTTDAAAAAEVELSAADVDADAVARICPSDDWCIMFLRRCVHVAVAVPEGWLASSRDSVRGVWGTDGGAVSERGLEECQAAMGDGSEDEEDQSAPVAATEGARLRTPPLPAARAASASAAEPPRVGDSAGD